MQAGKRIVSRHRRNTVRREPRTSVRLPVLARMQRADHVWLHIKTLVAVALRF